MSQRLRNKPRIDYKKMSTHGHSDTEDLSGSRVEGGTLDAGKPADKMKTVAERIALTPNARGQGGAIKKDGFFEERDVRYQQEMQKMKAEWDELEREEADLTRAKHLESMRRELEAKKKKVKTLRGKTNLQFSKLSELECSAKITGSAKSSVGDESNQTDSSDSDVDINKLRKDKKLKAKARKVLKKLALTDDNDSSDTDSTSESLSDSSSEDGMGDKKERKKKKKKSSSKDEKQSDVSYFTDDDSSDKKKKKKGKKKKSGINSKASDRVKFPQRWPQAYLQFEYVNKQLKFDDLDFKQFIAGEIEIIGERDLSKSERKGRLDMLKKIVYYSSIYEFRGLKAFYAAWVRDIERGIKKWSDDSSYLETAMLSKFVRNKGFQSRKDENKGAKSDGKSDGADKVWFCSEYNRNKCKSKSNHLKVISGKNRLLAHICATCWQTDKKKLEHPECSSSCPHQNA